MTGSDKRRRAYRRGQRYEFLARLYLLSKGYRLLETNFRSGAGEIDLIVRKGRTVAFVEVKVRDAIDDAIAAVSPQTQRRIAAAARVWLTQNPKYGSFTGRFDIVAFASGRWPRHLRSAFEER